MYYKAIAVLSLIAIGIIACRPTESPNPDEGVDLTGITYAPTAYTVVPPQGLPPMEIPAENPMTAEGIRLGRHLFYDPILSLDSTISCASCHKQEKAFTDGVAFSTGIDGLVGKRSSMSLINVGYNWIRGRQHNFMWDGRFATLEEQIIKGPIIDPVEMANTAENVEKVLRRHPNYPTMFREAFGIANSNEIKMEMVGKAIAQFERTLNSARSMYDKDVWDSFVYMSPQALNGMDIFQGDAAGSPSSKDGECGHCHSFSTNKALFARNEFSNNGLDSVVSLADFLDYGLGGATNNAPDNGMFREVSLRNIALTAPYMHDGRFQTLEEVMDHYVNGIHPAPNLASEISTATTLPQLTQADKEDIIAFLHALTDTSYVNKEEWSNPF
ncbi:MAG: cytochrome-c peroxidase [Aureispira sp.]